MKILVLGYVIRCPLGGMAWHYLQYVLGLAELGHEVVYLEDSEDHEWSCYNPATHEQGKDPTYGLAFAEKVFARLGLADQWAYFDAHQDRWSGPCGTRAVTLCADADLLLNISGANPIRPWLEGVPRRVFVDTDPGFEQVRQLTVPRRAARAAQHNAFFTFGENIGQEDCRIPADGLPWLPTRQPIVLSWWPLAPAPPRAAAFTSVMQWDSYEHREYEGLELGMKSRSFPAFLDLPRRVDVPLELALGSKGAPRDELRRHGWRLRDPLAISRDPWTYQQYLKESRGEFAVAKHGYVVTRSGWFSERSAAYLACGRPVVVQDTGFSRVLPVGEGLWAVGTVEEAAAALTAVTRDFERHSAAAREIAASCFDAEVVLGSLLDRVDGAT